MVKKIADIDFIVTNNETEALMLEATMIKKHLPKYNILLKDGKDHTYIKITREAIPRIMKTRIKTSSWDYFGPYLSTNYATNLLKIAKKVFGYRSCELYFIQTDDWLTIKNRSIKIPCIDYYIWRCAGPCLLEQDKIDNYHRDMKDIKNFLGWDYKEILKDLNLRMLAAAKKLDFETAQSLKQDIESIKALQWNQIVRDGIDWDCDILSFIEKYDKFYIGKLEIIDSRITGFYTSEIENSLDESVEEIFNTYIYRKYFVENPKKKRRIIVTDRVNLEPKDFDFIKLEYAKIWPRADLLKLCYKNTYEYANKKYLASLSTKNFTKQNMKNLLDMLGYAEINKDLVFECNDISHITWNHTVASRTVIENGKLNKSKYRKLRIKTLENQKIDDFNSMREVMQRRLLELEKLQNYPDLIIIDGWKWQLSSVMEMVEASDLKWTLQVVGLAKREEELFLPGQSKPIVLSKDSAELRLVQKIRDEAHRFAITFNRDSRIKAMKKNILEWINGIGPKTRKKIINTYGNVDNLRNVDRKELEAHLPKNVVAALEDHWLI